MSTSNPLPDLPRICDCICYGDSDIWPCLCNAEERALRAWASGPIYQLDPMTAPQREWCLSEISSVEGYKRQDYEQLPDNKLARSVLLAWQDYARDKGLI